MMMRVFVTGANGWVGSALVPELIAAGHQVTGLVRSEQKAEALRALGGEPLLGSLGNLETLKRGASQADDILRGTRTVPDFHHAVNLTRLVDTIMSSAETGMRKVLAA